MTPDPYNLKKRDPFIAGILGWLVPGLGHLYIGRPLRAAVFFVLVGGTFFAGLALGDFKNVRPTWERKFHYVAQIGCGGGALACTLGERFIGPWKKHVEDPVRRGVYSRGELHGTLYTCVAGLLNIMVLVQAGILAHTRGKPLPAREEDKR